MKKVSFVGILLLLLLFTTSIQARNEKSFSLPIAAKKVSENTYYLGKAKDKDSGKEVEGYAVIHKKEGKGKPPWAGGGDKKGATKCYGFLAKGAKWKTEEPYMIDVKNSGISESFVSSNMALDIAEWENAAGNLNILGVEIGNTVDGADTSSTDGKNEVMFGNMDSGTIAVTIVWGVFGGPPQGRELVEWDQVYNTYYPWSETGEPGKMDFWNIAIHELGHTFGLGDLYDSACADETMYGYGALGETKKRDLNTGDITGIQELYK